MSRRLPTFGRPGMSYDLITAVQKASLPDTGGIEFPKMLYRGPADNEETCVVESSEEEASRIAQGWSRTQAPRPPSKYPLHFVEITAPANPSARRVVIRNSSEEATFQRVTNSEDWMMDNKAIFGGTPVGLDSLIAQHSELLHRQLDQELQQSAFPSPEVESDTGGGSPASGEAEHRELHEEKE